MLTTRGLKATALAATGIGAGFVVRWLLDKLMTLYPTWATQIDYIGQGTAGVLVAWFVIIPIFEMYGVIRRGDRSEV